MNLGRLLPRRSVPRPVPAPAPQTPPPAAQIPPPRPPAPAFRPSALQRRFLTRVGQGMSATAAAEELDIARMTLYRWRQNPSFRARFAAAYLRDLTLEGWQLLAIAREQAATKFSYWKALHDLTFDPAARQRLLDWAEWCAHGSLASAANAVPAPKSAPAKN